MVQIVARVRPCGLADYVVPATVQRGNLLCYAVAKPARGSCNQRQLAGQPYWRRESYSEKKKHEFE